MTKCQHPGGVNIIFAGEELDPCHYEEIERHENVDVTVLRCKYCGAIDLEWRRRPETIDYILRSNNNDS